MSAALMVISLTIASVGDVLSVDETGVGWEVGSAAVGFGFGAAGREEVRPRGD